VWAGRSLFPPQVHTLGDGKPVSIIGSDAGFHNKNPCGNGGPGQGGGVFNAGPSPDGTSSLTLRSSDIVDNAASGGAAGIGGSDGQGVGGGVYNAGGTVRIHETEINHNHASTSDDDVFGDFS